jgi:hypothetical protein
LVDHDLVIAGKSLKQVICHFISNTFSLLGLAPHL